MKKISCVLWFAAVGIAQTTVESIPFRAVLSPQNEVPAIAGLDASGVGTVWLHVVKDATGRVVSGSADFIASYRFPAAITLTGMHVHRGAAGANGPVVIDSRLTSTPDGNGNSGISRQGPIAPDNATAIAAANDMLANPSGFYFNIHTTDNPGGAIRGQLERAQSKVFMGVMSPRNENPPIDSNASGLGVVTFLYTTRSDSTVSSASVTFDVSYTNLTGDALLFTGLHVHRGAVGVNGPVTIDSRMPGGANRPPVAASGTGVVSFTAELDLTSVPAVSSFYDMLGDPSGHYINIHTTANPGGVIRAQLRNTDAMSLQMRMVPANEVPPISGLDASADARFDIYSIRNESGAIEGAAVVFDVNHRFPGETTFTGLHIHNGAAGANGPVTVDSRITASAPVASPTGFGNIYRAVPIFNTAGLATLNSILTSPEGAYINLHTTVNPGGAVRAQVVDAVTTAPVVETVISAIYDPAHRITAPGGLIAIYGQNLARVSSTGGGGPTLDAPGSLNGSRVILGNRAAAVLSVSPRTIVAQTPVEGSTGQQPLYIIGPTGTSNTVQVQVERFAPGVFFDMILSQGHKAVAYKVSNLSYISDSNPATGGEDILVPMIGLGQVAPPLGTGQAGTSGGTGGATTTQPQVSIGGRNATRVSASAIPGMVGVYWLTINVPTGLAQQYHPLVVRMGEQNSNPTVIPVR